MEEEIETGAPVTLAGLDVKAISISPTVVTAATKICVLESLK